MSDEVTTESRLPVLAAAPERAAVMPAVAAQAAQAKAEVEAAYTIALHRPRDYGDARVRILRTCRRPAFANNKSTIYRKPVGGGQIVEGIGIRLAEEFAKALGNIRVWTHILAEDDERILLSVSATDLETNSTHSQDVVVRKVIERHKPRGGQEIVGQRQTSRGEIVYQVVPTEDEFVTKMNAQISKAVRNQISRLVPADFVEEAKAAIKATRCDTAAKDPDAYRKQVEDGFAELNIKPSQLKEYLGCPTESASPAQLAELRDVWSSIKQHETTWPAIMEARTGKAEVETGELALEDLKPGKAEPKPSKPKKPTAGSAPASTTQEQEAQETGQRQRKAKGTDESAAKRRPKKTRGRPSKYVGFAQSLSLEKEHVESAAKTFERLKIASVESAIGRLRDIGPEAFTMAFQDQDVAEDVNNKLQAELLKAGIIEGKEAEEEPAPKPKKEPEPPRRPRFPGEPPEGIDRALQRLSAAHPQVFDEALQQMGLGEIEEESDLDKLTLAGKIGLYQVLCRLVEQQTAGL